MLPLCALCRSVDPQFSEVRPSYDTPLITTPRFVVMPAVGPIVPGHVLIVSKEHLPNLAAMGEDALKEYRELVVTLRERDIYSNEVCIEAEHGASEHDQGGACITHVHVNFIPLDVEHTSLFDEKLPVLSKDKDLRNFNESLAPYIMLRGATAARVYEAKNIPSQLIRRALFETLGRDDWDWGAFPQLPIIERTLLMWGISAVPE